MDPKYKKSLNVNYELIPRIKQKKEKSGMLINEMGGNYIQYLNEKRIRQKK